MTLAIVGAGKIARAITGGLLQRGDYQAADIIGVARSESSREAFLAISPNLRWSTSPQEAVRDAVVILLAAKPFHFPELIPTLASFVSPEKLFISVAAGITLEKLEGWLGHQAKIIRAMPNTPALVQQGVTGICPNTAATREDLLRASALFEAVGKVFVVPENLMDAVTALSGSGPAYFYLFVQYLQKAAVDAGLPPETALSMAIHTASGAACMLEKTQLPPGELISQVKSKGGTTEAALNSFHISGLAETVKKAFDAATLRSQELSRA